MKRDEVAASILGGLLSGSDPGYRIGRGLEKAVEDSLKAADAFLDYLKNEGKK